MCALSSKVRLFLYFFVPSHKFHYIPCSEKASLSQQMLGREGTRLQVGTAADLDAIDFLRDLRREKALNDQFDESQRTPKGSSHLSGFQPTKQAPFGGGPPQMYPSQRGGSVASSRLSTMPSLSPI